MSAKGLLLVIVVLIVVVGATGGDDSAAAIGGAVGEAFHLLTVAWDAATNRGS